MSSAIKKDIMDRISQVSKKIREVEDFCKKLRINPDTDVYLASLKAYKFSLEETLARIKE